MRGCVVAGLVWLLGALSVSALEPKDVYLVANKSSPDSLRVAEKYVALRKVPAENVIALELPAGEDISRADYITRVRDPLIAALTPHKDQVKVLLTVYGVPLRIGGKVLTADEQAEEAKLKEEQKTVDASKDAARAMQINVRLQQLAVNESTSALDSELMLLWWPEYPVARWVFNPLYFQIPEAARATVPTVLMTSRLDGPTPDIAIRLVEDAVAVEQEGLKGKAYFDARGIALDAKQAGETGTGYAGYDESFREAAALIRQGGYDVTLDDKPELFAAETCPECALYAGWYSLANYIPAFRFQRGAVAWHLASSEAVTLRNAESKLWCPNLLKNGAAVTLGPVAEPYTIGFPKPAEFFGYLATGKYTVVECYSRTVLLTSWMGVLVGDPLYNPFAKSPLIKADDIHTSPKGIQLKINGK